MWFVGETQRLTDIQGGWIYAYVGHSLHEVNKEDFLEVSASIKIGAT
jgi:hypothetical protein